MVNEVSNSISEIRYAVYQDDDVYQREQERIYRGKTWSYLALTAELPNAGDYKSTYVGDTPVVVTRGQDGAIFAWVNRCAHKGAKVCRSNRGNSADGAFTCVYHQWAYNAAGELAGVPFRRGKDGVGGYDKSFKLSDHNLQKLRVESLNGMIFGTFADDSPELEEFLGDAMVSSIERIFHKPVKILGYAHQFMNGNWKLYSENSRDSYHGGLLHLFYPTFGIYRQGQVSRGETSENGFHTVFYVTAPKEKVDYKNYQSESNREMDGVETLQDPSVLGFIPEYDDDIALTIQSLFPSVVLQQIQNTLATRQVLPKGANGVELIWTYFGYADDDAKMDQHRIKNINLVGPAGFISMEDGEAVELCQEGIIRDADKTSLIKMGGDDVRSVVSPIGMDENGVRGFWQGYFNLMRD